MYFKEYLFKMLYERSFKYNSEKPFKLVSGNESPYYFDCKATMLDAVGLDLIGNIFIEAIEEMNVLNSATHIGGLTMDADPIVHAVSVLSLQYSTLQPIIVRKEAKKHGTQKYVEGNFKHGDKIIVVDDVITTGGSTKKAITKLYQAGLIVIGCIVLIVWFILINYIRDMMLRKIVKY